MPYQEASAAQGPMGQPRYALAIVPASQCLIGSKGLLSHVISKCHSIYR